MTNTTFGEAASDEQIKRTKVALEKNGFKVHVVDDLKAVHDAVIEQIPKGVEVFTATSVTLDEAGLTEELNSDDYISVRNKFMPLWGQEDKALEMKRIGSASDYAIGSVHALTEKEGYALIASATGSQLPNYVYGAKNFIWVVGSQKIVADLNEGIERVETHTFDLENERAKAAYGAPSSINKLLIYRKEPTERGTIYIVKQVVGY